MRLKIADYVADAINMLNKEGFEAYAVGNCILELASNKKIENWRIATDATPEDLLKLNFYYSKYQELDPDFSVYFYENKRILVSFYPNGVTKIEEYLSYLYPSMNCLAYHMLKRFIDPFNVMNDIAEEKVRLVNNDISIFASDPIRIFKILKDASMYGYEVDKEVKDLIYQGSTLLKVTKHNAIRFMSELKQIICGIGAKDIFLEFSNLFFGTMKKFKFFGDFNTGKAEELFHKDEDFAHFLKFLPKESTVRLGILFHLIYEETTNIEGIKPATKEFMNNVPISSKEKLQIRRLIDDWNVLDHIGLDRKVIQMLMYKHTVQTLRLVLQVRSHKIPLARRISSIVEDIVAKCEPITINQLAVHKNDLLLRGYTNKMIPKILRNFIRLVINGEVPNTKEDLIKRLPKKHKIKRLKKGEIYDERWQQSGND